MIGGENEEVILRQSVQNTAKNTVEAFKAMGKTIWIVSMTEKHVGVLEVCKNEARI